MSEREKRSLCILPGEATLAAFAPDFDFATLQADLQKVTA